MALIQDIDGSFSSVARTAQDPAADTGKLMVQFYLRPVEDAEKSAENGYKSYRHEEYVKIIVPGDKDQIVDRPVYPIDRERFANQYEKFQRHIEQTPEGTPLTRCPAFSDLEVLMLRSLHVVTLEQLAGMSDGTATKFKGADGILRLRQTAQDFLKVASDTSFATKLRAEVAKKDEEIATLQKALKEQSERLSKLENDRRR